MLWSLPIPKSSTRQSGIFSLSPVVFTRATKTLFILDVPEFVFSVRAFTTIHTMFCFTLKTVPNAIGQREVGVWNSERDTLGDKCRWRRLIFFSKEFAMMGRNEMEGSDIEEAVEMGMQN